MSDEKRPSWGVLYYDDCALCREVGQIIKDNRLDVNPIKIKEGEPGPHPCFITAMGRHMRKAAIEREIRRLCEVRDRIMSSTTK